MSGFSAVFAFADQEEETEIKWIKCNFSCKNTEPFRHKIGSAEAGGFGKLGRLGTA